MPATVTNHPYPAPFIEINSIDSTNNYAVQQLQKGQAIHGTAYFAYEQTAGKGQRGRQWHTQPGENIALSVVLNTKWLQGPRQFGLSMSVAMAAYDLFLKYAVNDTFIKWPNDLYWRDRKAAGILIENIVHGKEWQWAVAGIGMNINQTVFNSSIMNPVSLKQITGKNYDPVLLAKELCINIQDRFNQLHNNGSATLLTEYNNVLYKKNEKIRLKKDNAVFDGLMERVNADGQLVILAGGLEQVFNVGGVEWLIR